MQHAGGAWNRDRIWGVLSPKPGLSLTGSCCHAGGCAQCLAQQQAGRGPWHPPQHPSQCHISSPQPHVPGARRVLLAHTATARPLGHQNLSRSPLHPSPLRNNLPRTLLLPPARGDAAVLCLLRPHPGSIRWGREGVKGLAGEEEEEEEDGAGAGSRPLSLALRLAVLLRCRGSA